MGGCHWQRYRAAKFVNCHSLCKTLSLRASRHHCPGDRGSRWCCCLRLSSSSSNSSTFYTRGSPGSYWVRMAAGGFSLFSPPSLWKLGIFEGEAEADDRNALYLDKTARGKGGGWRVEAGEWGGGGGGMRGKGAALTERERRRDTESQVECGPAPVSRQYSL